jgi:hypothetical protein
MVVMVVMAVVPDMAGVRQARGQRRGGEEGGGHQKLRFGHFDSPGPTVTAAISSRSQFASRNRVKTTR